MWGAQKACHAEGGRQPSSQECGCRVRLASRGQQRAMAASGRSLGLLSLGVSCWHSSLSLRVTRLVVISRALGCRHTLEKHAVLLWPGLSKRMSATGCWGGDPTVANLLQGPGASSRSKTEVQNQSDLSRGFRAVPFPPPKCHLSILSPEPRQRYLSCLQGKNVGCCVGFPQ